MADIETLNAMMIKLQQIITGPADGTTFAMPENSFVSFCMPGIAISQEDVDFGFVSPTPQQNEAMADWSALVNSAPPVRGRFTAGTVKLYEAYGMMLRDAILPQVQLSIQEQNSLNAAHKLLYREIDTIGLDGGATTRIAETPLFEAYLERQVAWQQASEALKMLQADTLYSDDPKAQAKWALVGPTVRQRVTAAKAKFMIVKQQVEDALSTIATVGGRGPQRYWALLKDAYEDNQKETAGGGTFLPTKYFPNKFWDAASAGGWSGFSYNHEEEHKINESSQTSGGLSGGFGVGLWSVSAGGNYAEQKTFMKTDTSKAWVKAKLVNVPLRRSWFDATVFRSRAWKFDKNINNTVFSDGGDPPAGEMPAIITSVIFAKEVSIGVNWSSTEDTSFASQLSVNASVGWGPFSVRGNYSRNTNRTTHDFVKTDAGIEIPGMQIIGFVCEKLPKCPNPDLDLNWPA